MMKLAIAVTFLAASTMTVAQSPTVMLPAQLTSAHTMFLGYGGAEVLGKNVQEGASMLYSSAVKALSTGHYQLTNTPTNADLCGVISIDAITTNTINGNSSESASVRLAIFDTKTHSLLWTVEEPLEGAFRKASFQKNLEDSVAKLVADLNSLATGKLP